MKTLKGLKSQIEAWPRPYLREQLFGRKNAKKQLKNKITLLFWL